MLSLHVYLILQFVKKFLMAESRFPFISLTRIQLTSLFFPDVFEEKERQKKRKEKIKQEPSARE